MTLGSLFDGIGGWPLAAALNGIEPVWSSEIEEFPIAVTKERFPLMLHLGDVCKINGAEVPPVDILSSGSPCQDLSVAGKRAGIQHADVGTEASRSGLFLETTRIAKEMMEATNGEYPKYYIWENVPGALTAKAGKSDSAFRIVLEELIRCKVPDAVIPEPPKGKWPDAGAIVFDGGSLAWRILDAQYWGVPQRRRRIFLVCSYDGEAEQIVGNPLYGRAGKILFESEGLSWNSQESGKAWEGLTRDT